ncbi:Protein FAM19A5 [Collichthys lucidus]|uniref:Protein FAM19A5 n=1 Tax=Collichthys lucidus TaxID=240159 RepID=A0A4U5VUD3_COLLU|nr:Protein FAM19A5 [Collichthys lucidus]
MGDVNHASRSGFQELRDSADKVFTEPFAQLENGSITLASPLISKMASHSTAANFGLKKNKKSVNRKRFSSMCLLKLDFEDFNFGLSIETPVTLATTNAVNATANTSRAACQNHSKGTTAGIVRKKQWCEMVPCLEDEGCDLLVNKSGWTCTQPGGRVKTTTVSSGSIQAPQVTQSTHKPAGLFWTDVKRRVACIGQMFESLQDIVVQDDAADLFCTFSQQHSSVRYMHFLQDVSHLSGHHLMCIFLK